MKYSRLFGGKTIRFGSGRNPGKRRGSLFAPKLVAAFVSIVAVAGLVFWHFYPGRSRVFDGLQALAIAYGERRPIEARLSGLAYAPFISQRGAAHHVDQTSADLAERLLLEAVTQQPTAASHQALGQFRLLSGSPAKAVAEFEAALNLEPNNPSLRNDLAVALLELSRATDPPGDSSNTLQYLARSLEQVEFALQLDSTNIEALHNRGLVLNHLKLPAQRDKAWGEYLAKETDARWSAEAKHRVEVLSRSDTTQITAQAAFESFLAAAAAQDDDQTWHELIQNKEMITERFIPLELTNSFLTANAAGDREEAKRLLNALRYTGKLERERANDPFVSEIAEFYARSSPQQQKLLKAAHLQLKHGFELCLQGKYDESVFLEAKRLFLEAGNEWEARICDYWIAYCLSTNGKINQSNDVLNSLAEFSRDRNYRWLLGQAVCWLANNHTDAGEYSQSVTKYKDALAITTEINDLYNQQKILSQLGNTYLRLGQPERALDYDWRALQMIDPRTSSVRQTWRTYLYITRALIALNLHDAATQYGQEMLNLAVNALKDPAVIHYSYLYLAQINGGKKDFGEAIRIADESLKIANSIANGKTSQKLNSLLTLAHLHRQSGNLEQALENYEQVIAGYAETEKPIYRYDALKGQLLCYAALKDNANFEARLPRVLSEFELYRERIVEEQNANTFFDREQSVYDLAISHAFEKGDYVNALNYSEQSRARSLLKSLKDKTDQPVVLFNAADLKRSLPANVQVLEYSVLDDKLVAWLITNTSITTKTTNIKATQLRATVTDYLKRISGGPGEDDKLRQLSQQLHEILLGPFLSSLDSRKALCIIPDKILSYIPFAALISPASKNYLVADYLLFNSPSLHVLLHSTMSTRMLPRTGSETLLSIGNPSFDQKDYPELDDLPAAAMEAEGIAAYYPKPVHKFIGPQALKAAIEKRLPEANVIHFAGHYVTNQSLPLQSKLVFAKQAGTADSDLTVGELMGKKLPNARLVILSACETGGKEYYNGEGLTGIARTFLELGIPLVIASHWSVESESTAELMLKFHHYRKNVHLSSIEALRQAQLDMLNHQGGYFRDPYYWAAFTPSGGYVDF